MTQWGSPQQQPQWSDEQQWQTSTSQWQQPPQTPEPRRNNWWLAAVAALIVILGILAVWFFTARGDDEEVAEAPATTQTTVTVEEPAPVTVTERVQPPVTVTDRTTVRQTVTSEPDSKNWSDLMNNATGCSDPEYAATNGTDYVSVCRSGGTRVYKGWFNGKALELEGKTTRYGQAEYTIDAKPNTIEIDGAEVDVYDADGDLAASFYMTEWEAE
ncbi:hypothetical protein [Corynebacterium pelargi]|uniref:Uncharacterized protein n=1 Tax=Corynebacterium pelargi TaxID=1471400 RepID=A0A410WB53_9CORY|nr:hypothetical protein [Corynebacterium pelargi]QAU53182.1 hypothetical protein CPELA_09635 [Corynebacterium pelargi]GGG74275.1 hypothetical protein GCM10007338_09540 [Corynebacterium pelargi]